MLHVAEFCKALPLCVALALSVPLATPARAAAAPEIHAAPAPHALIKEDLEAFFDGIIPLQLERSDVAGATVLVMRGGETLLQKGYGFSDLKAATGGSRIRDVSTRLHIEIVYLDGGNAAGRARQT
jgi:CubicO group peptidase (beta-lactamase class C family)